MANNRKGLGRGLSTLLNGENYEDQINSNNNAVSGIDAFDSDVVKRKVEKNPLVSDTRNTTVAKQATKPAKAWKKSIEVIEVDISSVKPNPNQPRTHFDEEELEQLSASIKRNGLLQPISVTDESDGTYEIIAGERR